MRHEQKFDAVFCSAKVFDIRASQATAHHDAIFRCAWPSALDRHGTHAPPQRDLPADHARVAARESMFILALELDARARAIGFASEQNELVN